MKFIECQFMLALARAQYWQTLITSGAYKMRKTQRGCGRNEDGTILFRDLTDDEKLQSALATMERHIEFAQECADHIAEINLAETNQP